MSELIGERSNIVKFNHFANTVFNDFLNLVDQKIKTNDSKYGKLLRFLFRGYKDQDTVIFQKKYKFLDEDIVIRFLVSDIKNGRTVGGEYWQNVVSVYIAKSVLSDLEDEVKPIEFLNNVVESIKNTIVHETTHFYQDVKQDMFTNKQDLMYWTNFNLLYSQRVHSFIYLTRTEEMVAYMTEAYRLFRKFRKSLGVTYQQCLCSVIKERDNEERDSYADLISKNFDIDDLLSLYLQEPKDLPYYFAYLYIFYIFLPQTRYYYFVNEDKKYLENKPEEVNEDVATKNRHRIIKMMYEASELKKKRQMENSLKNLVSAGTFHKLFSLSVSNARTISKIKAEVFG